MKHLKVDSIEAESIILKHPDGKTTLSLVATAGGAGIWIDKDGRSGDDLVCIYVMNDQTCVGLYGKGKKDGVNLGLCVDDKGDPFVQVVKKDGKTATITADQLMKLAE